MCAYIRGYSFCDTSSTFVLLQTLVSVITPVFTVSVCLLSNVSARRITPTGLSNHLQPDGEEAQVVKLNDKTVVLCCHNRVVDGSVLGMAASSRGRGSPPTPRLPRPSWLSLERVQEN